MKEGIRFERFNELLADILSSYTVNIAYRANDPNVGMSLDKDLKRFKLFASDVGLFITLAFKDKKYTENTTSNYVYEIDFLISVGNKICPIEVKSGNYRAHKSLDMFCDKFSRRIKDKYVVHIKDYKREKGINYIPIYMLPFL